MVEQNKEQEHLVLAAKTLQKGYVFGTVRDGGIIKLTDYVGIKIVVLNDTYIQLQTIVPKSNEPIKGKKNPYIPRPKKKPVIKESKVSFQSKIESEELL